MRKISKEGLELVKQWEGLRLKAYQDVAGVWTIGYGHTAKAGNPVVQDGMEITHVEAEVILRQDLGQFEQTVEQKVTQALTDEQFAALVSFCYNIGTKAFCDSTLLKKLNQGDYEAVPAELQKWVKAGGKRVQGLVNRRAAEAGLWAKGAYVSSNYQEVEAKKNRPFFRAEVFAPLIASFSGLTGFVAGYGPVQWVLACIMIVAMIVGVVLYADRERKEQ
ncbi:lysozyme [Bartonella sp. AR 15-3]|uniref:lysozyme n=1 Tax=Bartonella sp. AR 15-3 TaxID=545617 RepID=UPI0001F4CF14|nr:lysozyme [Bartonella sp. AR 15-3]OPB32179.1 lysozyme [Bartonella sp. AR 15-3]CBI79824.1 Lysozyme [Bartonella sp. AR 15-3]